MRTDRVYVVQGLTGKWRLGKVLPDGTRTLLRSPSGRHSYLTAESAKKAADSARPFREGREIIRASEGLKSTPQTLVTSVSPSNALLLPSAAR